MALKVCLSNFLARKTLTRDIQLLPYTLSSLTSKWFKPGLVKAELAGFNLYSLRHTHATLLLANGENAKVASERLGHSTIVLTLDTYSHVLPDMQQGAAKRIEELLFKTGT